MAGELGFGEDLRSETERVEAMEGERGGVEEGGDGGNRGRNVSPSSSS